MLNRLLLLIVVVEIALLVLIKPITKEKRNYNYSIDSFKLSNIDKAKLENYIIGVVAAEMPATFSIESLKAQAVAARTFAYKKIQNNRLNFDNLINDKGQAYINNDEMKKLWKSKYGEYYEKISDAVLSTKGEIITYHGDVINAYYFSISNGKTEDSSQVFGEEDYLVSVESPWDIDNQSYDKTITMNLDIFKKKLGIDNDVMINDINRSSTNHVNYIVVNNNKYDGVTFRKMFNLRSTDFNISINKDVVSINTKGHGHGVGMSQHGANSLAKEGKNYEQIIKYYYKGVELSKI